MEIQPLMIEPARDRVMIEEWLFWDNAAYMKQTGTGKLERK